MKKALAKEREASLQLQEVKRRLEEEQERTRAEQQSMAESDQKMTEQELEARRRGEAEKTLANASGLGAASPSLSFGDVRVFIPHEVAYLSRKQ